MWFISNTSGFLCFSGTSYDKTHALVQEAHMKVFLRKLKGRKWIIIITQLLEPSELVIWNEIQSKGKHLLELGVQEGLFERSPSVMILKTLSNVINSHSNVIYLQNIYTQRNFQCPSSLNILLLLDNLNIFYNILSTKNC